MFLLVKFNSIFCSMCFYSLQTVTCDLCKNKNKVVLYKKSSTDSKAKESKTEVETDVPKQSIDLHQKQVPAKKKKKKKDKNAGLIYTLNKTDTNSAKKIVNLCQQTQTLNIQKSANISNKFNKNTNKNKTNTTKGPKQKSKNISQPAPRRNILLLANALKAKSNQSNSQADKLKQMLR